MTIWKDDGVHRPGAADEWHVGAGEWATAGGGRAGK